MKITNKKKIMGLILGTALAITSVSPVFADIVIDNGGFNNSYGSYGYGYGYSLSTAKVYTTKATPTDTTENTTTNTTENTTTNATENTTTNTTENTTTNTTENTTTNTTENTTTNATENTTTNTTENTTTNTTENTTTNTTSNVGYSRDYSSPSWGSGGSYSLSDAKKIETPLKETAPTYSTDTTEVTQSTPGFELTSEQQTLLDLINQDRVAAGLDPLQIDPTLVQIAQTKSQDMYDNNYFSHNSPTFGKTSSLIKEAGIKHFANAENIGRTYSVYRAHSGFMNSDGHRKNIMNSRYTHIGIGIVGNYYTEVFIQKLD